MCEVMWLPSSRITSNGPNSSATSARKSVSCCAPIRTCTPFAGLSNCLHSGSISTPTIGESGCRYWRHICSEPPLYTPTSNMRIGRPQYGVNAVDGQVVLPFMDMCGGGEDVGEFTAHGCVGS